MASLEEKEEEEEDEWYYILCLRKTFLLLTVTDSHSSITARQNCKTSFAARLLRLSYLLKNHSYGLSIGRQCDMPPPVLSDASKTSS